MYYACFGALITVPLNWFNQESEGFSAKRIVVPDGKPIAQGNLGFLLEILDCPMKLVSVLGFMLWAVVPYGTILP